MWEALFTRHDQRESDTHAMHVNFRSLLSSPSRPAIGLPSFVMLCFCVTHITVILDTQPANPRRRSLTLWMWSATLKPVALWQNGNSVLHSLKTTLCRSMGGAGVFVLKPPTRGQYVVWSGPFDQLVLPTEGLSAPILTTEGNIAAVLYAFH